jgi:hypothetical protein
MKLFYRGCTYFMCGYLGMMYLSLWITCIGYSKDTKKNNREHEVLLYLPCTTRYMFIVYIDNRTLAGTCVPVYTFPFIHYINLDIKTSTHNVVHRQDPFLDRISRTIFITGVYVVHALGPWTTHTTPCIVLYNRATFFMYGILWSVGLCYAYGTTCNRHTDFKNFLLYTTY